MVSADGATRVLVVDDDPKVGIAFAGVLGRLGYETDLAVSAAEALRLARARFYPVVITDLRMPGIDGLGLIERMSPMFPTTAFVLLTGLPELDLRSSRAVDGAIASIVQKPWDDDGVAATMKLACDLHRKRAAQARSADGAEARPAGILLVEDNPADADLLTALLERELDGTDFVRVGRLTQALACLHERQFDAIFTDLSLPDARGFDAITRLQAAAPATPVLVVSGLADEELALQAVQLGAQDFLVKEGLTTRLVLRALRHAQERKRAEQRLVQMAHYDQLTGLANRNTFHEQLSRAVTRARRRGGRFAVMYLDLDRFKAINDTLGHDAGDALLEEVGRRLQSTVRDYDTVARLGGDEFAALIDDLESDEILDDLCERMLAALRAPVLLAGQSIRITCSLGVAVYPDAAGTPTELLKRADTALYEAKRTGRDGFARSTSGRAGPPVVPTGLSGDLEQATRGMEFALEFRPRYALETERLVGVAAAVLWRPGERSIGPAQLLQLLEASGGVHAVGRWALGRSCTQAVQWRSGTLIMLELTVRMSAARLEKTGFAAEVSGQLARAGLPPGALVAGITEADLSRLSPPGEAALVELRERGVQLTILDLGADRPSEALIRRIREHGITLAQAALPADPTQPAETSAWRRLTDKAGSLGLVMVAEGELTSAQLACARATGCGFVEGLVPGWAHLDHGMPQASQESHHA